MPSGVDARFRKQEQSGRAKQHLSRIKKTSIISTVVPRHRLAIMPKEAPRDIIRAQPPVDFGIEAHAVSMTLSGEIDREVVYLVERAAGVA